MLITIFNSLGEEKAQLSPNDSSTQVKEIQGDSVLTLSFTHYDHIELEVDDYVDFESERFWLTEKYRPKQNAHKEWVYDVKLYGVESMLKRLLVIKSVDGEDNPIFTLTAPPHEHVAMIVGCMNNGLGNITDWKVGTVMGAENIVIDYFGKYCDQALKEIAEKVGAEAWVDGDTVNICKCEHGEPIAMGYQKGLLSIDPGSADNVKFYTRLYPVGSSRNIDREKYGYSRLQLPGGQKFVEINADKYGRVDHYEQDAFAGIYPRRIGTVSEVRSEVKTGEDGNELTIYYFKDSGLNFDPNDYEIGGFVKRVSFQEGSELAGLGDEENGTYFFEVNFNTASQEFEIITIWPYDNETQLPGDTLVPKPGDKYILWNISMPDEYYALAEAEFLAAVEQYNADHNLDISVYKAPTDHVWIEDNEVVLTIGQRIRLESDEYFPETGYRDSRITKITRKVNLPSSMDIEISDALSKTSLEKVSDSIEDVRTYVKSIAESTSLPDIIKTGDRTRWTDNNLLSAARSAAEFLSKLQDDIAKGLIKFAKGAQFGASFAEGLAGAQIDARGNAEFEDIATRKGVTIGNSYQPGAYGGRIWVDGLGKVHIETDYLEAREKIEAKEVEIQEETHVGGCQIISPASMRCSRAIPVCDEADSVIAYKCFFTAEDERTGARIYNQFQVGDLAKCETFNLAKQPNGKMGNHYFWRKVIEAGYVSVGDADYDADCGMEGYIILSNKANEKDAASDAPLAGDRIVTVGNDDPAKSGRSNLIVLSSYGTGSPYIYQFKGINTFALTKSNLKTAISPDGNVFTGKVVIENDSEEIDVRDYIENNIYLGAYQLVLSNEMAAVPCDVDGNVIGDLPSTKVTIYKGKAVETGWTIGIDAAGCAASMVGDSIYLSALTSKNATVTVTAAKQDCPTLAKVMTICKLKEGEMGVSGDHAVQFEIEPDKPIVLADMDGACDPAALGCKVYMVIGNQSRVEVPLANTAPITTYKAGDKLLFFNGRLFVSRPVELDVPTDLILRYAIVNQDYIADAETGKVGPVTTSESEHIYTGNPIAMASRMKHVIFKLYRGNMLVDMQTVIVTTDATAMKVAYNTRFEVNEKEILAHAARISQNEQAVTELRMTADGISADISKQSGIIQDFIDGAGRNLLLKTNQGSANWQYHTDSAEPCFIQTENAENGGEEGCSPASAPFAIATGARSDSTYEAFTYALRPELIKSGEKYTLSFTISNLSEQPCSLELFAQIANADGTGALTEPQTFPMIVENGEYGLSVSLTASSNGEKHGPQQVRIGIAPAALNRWTALEFSNLKLEKGETATAYSAAPEDSSECLYSLLSTKIEITAEGLRSEVAQQIGESEDRINSAHQSLISQAANEILARVQGWDAELGASISQIRQTAATISLKVDGVAGGLLATGIDIENKNIVLTSDSVVFRNNDGEESMFIDENGQIFAKFINADELRARRLTAGDEGGQRVEIMPETRAIKIFDQSGIEVNSFEGNRYHSLNSLFSSDESAVTMRNRTETDLGMGAGTWYWRGIASATTSSQEPAKEEDMTVILTEPVHTAVRATFKMTYYIEALAAIPSDVPDTPSSGGQYQAGDATAQDSAASIKLWIQTYADAGLTRLLSSVQAASAASNGIASASADNFGGTQTTKCGGYHVLALRISLKAYRNKKSNKDTTVTVRWGQYAGQNGNYGSATVRDIKAKYVQDSYVSRFLANGFCLGRSQTNYAWMHEQEGTAGMRFAMCNGGYGFDFSGAGFRHMVPGGTWLGTPMLIYKARYYRNGTAWTVTAAKSITGAMTAQALSTGRVMLNFPEAWKTALFAQKTAPEIESSLIVHAIGYSSASSSQPVTVTLNGIDATGITLLIHKGTSQSDEPFSIAVYCIP